MNEKDLLVEVMRSKFEIAEMDFYKILLNFIFISLLATKWYAMIPFIQQRLTLEDGCNAELFSYIEIVTEKSNCNYL